MSTVVALGHFCEVHGPRLVFYTIRNIHEPQFVSQCPDLKFCSGCKAPLLEGYISTVQTVHNTPTQTPSPLNPLPSTSSANKNNSFGAHHSSSSSLLKSPPQSQPNLDSTLISAPCSSTAHSSTTKYYCSHSNYDHSHLAHLHTCVARTLSCEISPSNSVAFSSSDIWAIGSAFSLKDSQARGFHRKYCLIFTFLPETHEQCLRRTAVEAASQGVASRDLGITHKQLSNYKSSLSSQQQQRSAGTYSDGDIKGTSGSYPSLVPYYDFITEEFYNISKGLLSECEKVYYKEQSVSPQRGTKSGSCEKSGKDLNSSSTRSLPLLSANPHIFLDLHEKFARVLHHVDL